MPSDGPMWARELLAQVYADVGRDDLPTLGWQERANYGARITGRTWSEENRIHISVGNRTPRKDQHYILLHEIAHALLPSGEHHSERFWTLAFMLYIRYGADVQHAYACEIKYRKAAGRGYGNACRLLGKDGK